MEAPIRVISVARGYDPRLFTLVAFGGAGPLHAAMVARELRIARVIVPRAPGHFSAFGMLLSDLRNDFAKSLFIKLADVSFEALQSEFADMEERGRSAIARSGLTPKQITVTRSMDMRYVGQEHAVTVDVPIALFKRGDRRGIKRHFDELHKQRYGRGSPLEEAEIVSLRSTVSGVLPKPPLARIETGSATPPKIASRDPRPVHFAGRSWVKKCPVFDRDALRARNRIAGPALIEEHASTTVLPPGDRLTVDAYGNLVIESGRTR
jgi:N-methylhydantoinase A